MEERGIGPLPTAGGKSRKPLSGRLGVSGKTRSGDGGVAKGCMESRGGRR